MTTVSGFKVDFLSSLGVSEMIQFDSTLIFFKVGVDSTSWIRPSTRWQRSRRRWKASWRAWCVAVPWMSCRCADLLPWFEAVRSILGWGLFLSFNKCWNIFSFFWIIFGSKSYTIWDCISDFIYTSVITWRVRSSQIFVRNRSSPENAKPPGSFSQRFSSWKNEDGSHFSRDIDTETNSTN